VRGQELMAGISHTAEIKLRFRDPAGEFLDFGIFVGAGHFAGERFHPFGQCWIGINRQAQTVAKSVSGRAAAALCGLRAGAGPRILAVSPDLAVARQAAFFPRLDHFNFGVLELLRAPSQCLAKDGTAPIDLAL
jgi:hypothetical protein